MFCYGTALQMLYVLCPRAALAPWLIQCGPQAASRACALKAAVLTSCKSSVLLLRTPSQRHNKPKLPGRVLVVFTNPASFNIVCLRARDVRATRSPLGVYV